MWRAVKRVINDRIAQTCANVEEAQEVTRPRKTTYTSHLAAAGALDGARRVDHAVETLREHLGLALRHLHVDEGAPLAVGGTPLLTRTHTHTEHHSDER